MSSVTIAGDTSGSVLLQAPSVAGSTTVNIPAATGTMMVSGNMPAFSAYKTSNQSYSANTWTKITQTVPGDTGGTWVGATNASAARLFSGNPALKSFLTIKQ